MRLWAQGIGAALALWPLGALAEGGLYAGHDVSVAEDRSSTDFLLVDGQTIHEDDIILLDPEPLVVGGVTVVTGVAGAGGNACNAAPFVLALPEGGAPEMFGPVLSCAWLTPTVQNDTLVFISEPSAGQPGEIWTWSRTGGFLRGDDVAFAPSAGWEALDGLAGAHPVDAIAIAPVYAALEAGLGAEFPLFLERISELGSGDLVPGGYRGEACLKFTCEADYAAIYIDRASQQVFVVWHVMGEIENRIWPADTTTWPEPAMAMLREKAGP